MPPANAVCWIEIPVTDMAAATRFYESVLEAPLTPEEGGPNPMAAFAYERGGRGVSGHLYPGRPAPKGTGPTVHLVVAALEPAMERLRAAGGEVVSPAITIPAGRFAYCLDPDGNSIGLFQA